MSKKKIPFSVSDRKKLDNCICMKCTYRTCLMLDGKCCNQLVAPKLETKKTEERK
ncbi:MAG: hypothetical protein PHV32_12445 [Eubacteriales bacterium]|nr:hypothetical protein [Eubacteriales bacterium]